MRDEDLIAYEREAYLARERRRLRQAARRKAQARRRRLRFLFLVLLAVLLTIIVTSVDAGGTGSDQVTGKLETPAPAAVPTAYEIEAQEPSQVNRDEELPLSYLGEFRITHYCACESCCGKSEDDPWYGITATGTVATEGRTIAVDPDVIPYGSKVAVFYDDGRICHYIAEDCGGAINGNDIDVFIADHDRAKELGVLSGCVYIVNEES